MISRGLPFSLSLSCSPFLSLSLSPDAVLLRLDSPSFVWFGGPLSVIPISLSANRPARTRDPSMGRFFLVS
ncbi:hypothetical protein BDV26DRAFT_273505 [Aspergillus bertholletiae]|uniref:Uncharacterized protein n=1 Tax=Aspergillus bertholletiae TaxID=1226010 RepID=A0A5N7ASB9_9EURO|nr:hypothetical protein BDV26DRAFT_273505 [Aspergillus bertholletiae]